MKHIYHLGYHPQWNCPKIFRNILGILNVLPYICDMKYNKLYLVKTLSVKGSKELDPEVQKMLLNQIGEVLDEGDDKEIAVEEVDDVEVLFFRLSYMKVMRICSILDPYVEYSIEEVSEKIISGDMNEYDFIMKSDEFKKFFDTFRLDITSVDDVLDKILSKGINSIDDVDKMILEKI